MAETPREQYLRLLREEIDADPAGRGYTGQTAAQVAALLNEPYADAAPNPRAGLIETALLEAALSRPSLAAVGQTGLVIWDLLDAADKGEDNPATGNPFPGPIRAALRRAINWLRRHPTLNLGDPDTQVVVTGLQQAGLLTVEQAAGILALGEPATVSEPRLPRIVSVILGVPEAPNACSAADVAEAMGA